MKDVLAQNRLVKIKDLRANKGQLAERGIPTNPRKITKEKYNLLLQSLEKSNLTQIRPLDVIEHDGKFIVLSGNQRLRALKELKIKEVPCNILRDDLEPETYRQIVLQANTNYGEHDDDLLANEWDAVELHEWGYDLPCWEEEKIEQETQGDDDVPVSAPAITVKGDLYTLGEHRLLCGDSTMIDDVEKLMDGAKADMVFTDPPYGMNYNPDWTGVSQKTDEAKKFIKDKKCRGLNYKRENVENDDREFDPSFLIEFCRDAKEQFWWGFDYYAQNIAGRNKGSIVVWDKRTKSDGESMDEILGSCFELCWSRKRHKRDICRVLWAGLFGTEKEHDKKRLHPTQKPVELVLWFLEKWGKDYSIVDFFLGSGSTLIACEKTNRKCYGMELDEKYCDVIVKRYIEFSVKNNKEAKVYRNGDLIINDVFLVESEGKS